MSRNAFTLHSLRGSVPYMLDQLHRVDRWLTATLGALIMISMVPTAPAVTRHVVVVSSHQSVLTPAQIRYDSLLACPTTLDQIGRVVIPVKINGLGPFRFVIDTGANHSAISARVALLLNVKSKMHTRVELEGITGSNITRALKIRTIQAGALTIRNVFVPVIDTPMMAGADGILGLAGFPSISLFVNFPHNRVEITRTLTPGVRFDYSRIHTETVAGGLMAVPAYVKNIRTLAIIDTGSERTLGNIALRSALHMQPDIGKPESITVVFGATNQIEIGRLARSPPISVGSLRVLGAEIIFGNFHIFKIWKLDQRPAIILGMDILGTVNALGFDFKQHELFVDRKIRFRSSNFDMQTYQVSTKIH